MLKYFLAALCVASFLAASLAQERVKPKGPADFIKSCDELKTHWSAERYGSCIGTLREMLGVAVVQREEKIVAALPVVDKFTKRARGKGAAENPFAAAMASTVGNVIEETWTEDDGRRQIKFNVTVDSPMVSMMSMLFANPAAQGGELIKYNDHRAILKKQGQGLSLLVLLLEEHTFETTTNFDDEDYLFSVVDQEAVDKLVDALSR